jgi:hypothetical protein
MTRFGPSMASGAMGQAFAKAPLLSVVPYAAARHKKIRHNPQGVLHCRHMPVCGPAVAFMIRELSRIR